MWVRSQDRKTLLKTNKLIIKESHYYMKIGEVYHIATEEEYNTNIVWEIQEIIDNNTVGLGCYSTEEKALKVLDMLERHINGNVKRIKCYGNEYIEDNLKLKVFNMPQDSEV